MSKSGSSQTSTTTIDPDIKKAYLQNLQQAQGVASALPVREFADFNPIYRAGEEQLVNTGLAGRGIDTTNIAAEYANQAAQFQPYYTGNVNAGMSNQFGAVGYTPTDVTAAQSNMSNIGQYMNPYTNQVISNNLADIEAARQSAVQQMGEAATRAKAYGGTRQGVAEAATNKAYADKAAQMSAQLRMQGFDTSTNLMQQDLARQQQANLLTAQQGTGAAQYGAGAINAAMGGNAAALNEMQRSLAEPAGAVQRKPGSAERPGQPTAICRRQCSAPGCSRPARRLWAATAEPWPDRRTGRDGRRVSAAAIHAGSAGCTARYWHREAGHYSGCNVHCLAKCWWQHYISNLQESIVKRTRWCWIRVPVWRSSRCCNWRHSWTLRGLNHG